MVRRTGVVVAVYASLLGCATAQSGSRPALGAAPLSAPSTIESIVGQYALVAIDGHALPFSPSAQKQAAAWPVVAGSLVLNSNGILRIETSYDAKEQNQRASVQVSGTCFAAGDEVRMVWDGGGLTNLTVRGDTLLVDREGQSYSYVRR